MGYIGTVSNHKRHTNGGAIEKSLWIRKEPDDEETIIEISRKILESLGYRVVTARSGEEAISIYREQMGDIDLVILDMIMPDMSGRETYEVLKTINPHIKVLLSSGYSLSGQAQEIINRGCQGFIQKPFTVNALSQKIRDVLNDQSVLIDSHVHEKSNKQDDGEMQRSDTI